MTENYGVVGESNLEDKEDVLSADPFEILVAVRETEKRVKKEFEKTASFKDLCSYLLKQLASMWWTHSGYEVADLCSSIHEPLYEKVVEEYGRSGAINRLLIAFLWDYYVQPERVFSDEYVSEELDTNYPYLNDLGIKNGRDIAMINLGVLMNYDQGFWRVVGWSRLKEFYTWWKKGKRYPVRGY